MFISHTDAQVLDSSYLECTYEYALMRDTLVKQISIEDPAMILLIGNKYSKFYSYNTFFRDSIVSSKTDSEKMDIIGSISEFAQKYPKGESSKIYKNNIDKTITLTDKRGLFKFLYKEPNIKQNWKITDETKEIAGYECQKATCTFRGRNYIAWFTREIPVNEGPWKFNGLPGLIVKVYDIQEHYKFELYAVRKVKKEITFEEQNYAEMDRKDYIKTQRRYLSNPLSAFGGGTIKNDDGTPFIPKSFQYDVMERDIK